MDLGCIVRLRMLPRGIPAKNESGNMERYWETVTQIDVLFRRERLDVLITTLRATLTKHADDGYQNA